jgi:hypothetical protein
MQPVAWVEGFVLGNLAFLALDVYMAHSFNAFEVWLEWLPIYFSIVSPVLLAATLALDGLTPPLAGALDVRRRLTRAVGLLVGWGAVLLGVAGMILHLRDSFFREQTLRSLVYTAPFVAPLSYSGLGLLLILDRMTPPRSREWARWVLVLALGGFFGNFVLSLADHAQNGFFFWREWIAVVSAALAVGFLTAVLLNDANRPFRRLCFAVLGLQVLVGLLGFYYHVNADLHGPMRNLWDNFIYGAPAFAPLLFANLAVLAAIGLWALELDDRRA